MVSHALALSVVVATVTHTVAVISIAGLVQITVIQPSEELNMVAHRLMKTVGKMIHVRQNVLNLT